MNRLYNFVRNINYLMKHSLWDQREEDIVYLTKKILDDGIYEYGLELNDCCRPSILSKADSLKLIIKNKKSFVRTGDGECKIMEGMDQPFQKYEKEIADKLKQLLSQPREDLYVGINRNYFIPLRSRDDMQSNYYRRHGFEHRETYYKYLNVDMTYLDATVTTYTLGMRRNEEIDAFFNEWKSAFEGQDLIIVCGEGILENLQYDIFTLARSKKFIYGPRKNAWDQHDSIMEKIKNETPQNHLVVFILGMAGKAMIPELTDLGYVCWDLGHLAKYYNAYLSEVKGTETAIRNFYAPD